MGLRQCAKHYYYYYIFQPTKCLSIVFDKLVADKLIVHFIIILITDSTN